MYLCLFVIFSLSLCLHIYLCVFPIYFEWFYIYFFVLCHPWDGTVPSQVATQLEAERGCRRGQGEVPDSNWESLHRNQVTYNWSPSVPLSSCLSFSNLFYDSFSISPSLSVCHWLFISVSYLPFPCHGLSVSVSASLSPCLSLCLGVSVSVPIVE